jgi:hypothetical protein
VEVDYYNIKFYGTEKYDVYTSLFESSGVNYPGTSIKEIAT